MITRLEKFNKRPTKSEAEAIAEDLDILREAMQDASDTIEELAGYVETWLDEDADRDDKREAREEIDSVGSDLIEKLREVLDGLNA